MVILELIMPGSFITTSTDEDENSEMLNLIEHIVSNFHEANQVFNYFIQAEEEKEERDFDVNAEQWQADYVKRQRIQLEIEKKYSPDEIFDNYRQILFETEQEFVRSAWVEGQEPRSFSHNKMFIFARTYLFALDNYEKALRILEKVNSVPDEIKFIVYRFEKLFPDLREVRNSAHHIEDRIRGLQRNNKIVIKHDAAHPFSGALAINILYGNCYGCTLGNGTYGEVEVSQNALTELQNITQDLLNIFAWKGMKQMLPT